MLIIFFPNTLPFLQSAGQNAEAAAAEGEKALTPGGKIPQCRQSGDGVVAVVFQMQLIDKRCVGVGAEVQEKRQQTAYKQQQTQ